MVTITILDAVSYFDNLMRLHLTCPHLPTAIAFARPTINTFSITSPQVSNPANTTFPTGEQAVIHIVIVDILAIFEKLSGYLHPVVTWIEIELISKLPEK
ncbi:unnamed protein product [Fusarium graminearum]|uniref:Uncharacterized protein n=1 Tax=Gibberella zeae TaxID=5518 RepID=A0A4E9DRH9_GIBZA|nr:unnamed protein product [Fusarium graminearum]CAG2014705.1 unnamed protein product [Fusarium graminearum]